MSSCTDRTWFAGRLGFEPIGIDSPLFSSYRARMAENTKLAAEKGRDDLLQMKQWPCCTQKNIRSTVPSAGPKENSRASASTSADPPLELFSLEPLSPHTHMSLLPLLSLCHLLEWIASFPCYWESPATILISCLASRSSHCTLSPRCRAVRHRESSLFHLRQGGRCGTTIILYFYW